MRCAGGTTSGTQKVLRKPNQNAGCQHRPKQNHPRTHTYVAILIVLSRRGVNQISKQSRMRIGSVNRGVWRAKVQKGGAIRYKKSERPVGVPAARGHGGDGGAVFEVPPGSKVRVANPWSPHRESTCRMPLASGGVDRPSVQLVPVRKYLRRDSRFVRHGTESAVLVRQRCCVFPAVIRSPKQIVRSSPAG